MVFLVTLLAVSSSIQTHFSVWGTFTNFWSLKYYSIGRCSSYCVIKLIARQVPKLFM